MWTAVWRIIWRKTITVTQLLQLRKERLKKNSGWYRIRTPDHCDTPLRCTGIAEVRGLNPVQASVFFVSGFLFATAKVDNSDELPSRNLSFVITTLLKFLVTLLNFKMAVSAIEYMYSFSCKSLRSGSDQQRCSNQLRLWCASEVELSFDRMCKEMPQSLFDDIFAHVREPWTVLDSRFRIQDTGFQYLSVELGFWIPIVSEIPDSTTKDSGFHKQKFPGIRISLHGTNISEKKKIYSVGKGGLCSDIKRYWEPNTNWSVSRKHQNWKTSCTILAWNRLFTKPGELWNINK